MWYLLQSVYVKVGGVLAVMLPLVSKCTYNG